VPWLVVLAAGGDEPDGDDGQADAGCEQGGQDLEEGAVGAAGAGSPAVEAVVERHDDGRAAGGVAVEVAEPVQGGGLVPGVAGAKPAGAAAEAGSGVEVEDRVGGGQEEGAAVQMAGCPPGAAGEQFPVAVGGAGVGQGAEPVAVGVDDGMAGQAGVNWASAARIARSAQDSPGVLTCRSSTAT
jgi:hypothetical protein